MQENKIVLVCISARI